jgi:hypothetical protein
MAAPPTAAAGRLLVLADELATVHAEVGEARTHALLLAVVDSTCQALVDLADGRRAPTVPTPVPPVPDSWSGTLERGSCAAAAAALRSAHAEATRALSGEVGTPEGLAGATLLALEEAGEALRELAGATDDGQLVAALPRVHRTLRRCHRRLQPPDTLSP